MIAVGTSARLASPRDVVWAFLVRGDARLHWWPGLEASIGPVPEQLEVGEAYRWRCRVRDLPIELREEPVELCARHRLRSRLALGLFRCELTFNLLEDDEDPAATRLATRIAVEKELPLVGGALDRFAVRGLALTLASTVTEALRDYCALAPRPSPEPRTSTGALVSLA